MNNDESSLLSGPQFDVSNHEVPFGPIESDPELVELLNVEGWSCSNIVHEAPSETECHELQDGEWVYTGTIDHGIVEHHAIDWTGEYTVPGIDNSSFVKVGIEYSDSVIFTDENGDVTGLDEGYILFGDAFTEEKEWVGEIQGDNYTNLASALTDAVCILSFIRDGVLPAETTSERPIRDLIEDITGTKLPDN